MNRPVSVLATTVGLVLAGVALAPLASANITNPADNPHKITVTGDDGNTYVDGQDTLPGYDDVACTYIPGAYYDFENNKVRYADGQSITWTEWDRATGYKDWQATKQAATPAAPAPAPAPAAGGSGGSAGSTGTGSGKPASAVAQASAGAPDEASATEAAAPNVSAEPSAAADDASAAPAPSAESDGVVAADGAPEAAKSGGGSSAGLAILAGLFGVGGLAFGGYTFLRRGTSGKAS